MIYSFAVSTPANTLAAAPVTTTLSLVTGIVHQIEFLFPTGCAGLLFIAIRHGLHQVWPTNPTESFHTDGETISFKEHYELPSNDSQLLLASYNLDDTYAHEVHLRIGILQRSEIQGLWLPWSDALLEELMEPTA